MPSTPEQLWQTIAKSELARSGVTGGPGVRPFRGAQALGKVFAMLKATAWIINRRPVTAPGLRGIVARGLLGHVLAVEAPSFDQG